MSEKSQAYQEFVRLLTHAKEIIAKMYQGDENPAIRCGIFQILRIQMWKKLSAVEFL